MIESYINEYCLEKYVGDNPNVTTTYGNFLSECTPFIADTNRKVMWFSESKELGLFYNDEISIVDKTIGTNSPRKLIIKKLKSSRTNFEVYLQRSADGSVWYLRDACTPSNDTYPAEASVVIAKTSDGWAAFTGDIMATKAGYVNLAASAPTNESALYTIQKMSTVDGKSFLELYKVFYAGNFEKTSTVISRDNTLYRVVSTDNDHAKPSFAFPVSEAVWDGTN